jgi:SAM-dependent methyltransferase
MPQNVYDNQDFFEAYSKLPRSVRGLEGAPEWSSLQALLPDLEGLRVADLGCGYGWFCRWAHEHGARTVHGFDVSEKMLLRARELTKTNDVRYVCADLEELQLPPSTYDLVYSSLTFHYVDNLKRLFENVYESLAPAGALVFSIEHPIYMASLKPEWIEHSGRKAWPVDNYQQEGSRITDWLAPGVIKQHRTIGTIINGLIASGFSISHVEDWGPSDEQVDAQPELAQERERPMFLLVSACR